MNNYLKALVLLMSFPVVFSSNYGQELACSETRECEDQTIGTTDLYCYGYYGCSNADITANTLLFSYAYGTSGADISTTSVYAYGYRAGFYATIKATTVYSYGYQSSYSADISPKNTLLTVYFNGYYAGKFAEISCYSGNTCEIYCEGFNGCTDTNFYCYSDAVCIYHSFTDPENVPTQFGNGGDESSGLYLSDIQIKAIYDRNVAEKNKRFEAEKEGNTFGVESELPVMDIFEHLPNCEGGNISYGMAAFIAVLSTVVGMTVLYFSMLKRINDGYFKI